jgi:predicted ArsR family transcriptional regulator
VNGELNAKVSTRDSAAEKRRRQTSIAAVAALADAVRARLYEHVRSAQEPVTREGAADAVGISRKLAAFHLDKLVAVGLLRAGTQTDVHGRVGRAPKVYSPVDDAMHISVPQRSHDTLATILVDAVVGAREGEAPAAACYRSACSRGRTFGASHHQDDVRDGTPSLDRVESWLDDQGYEPYRSASHTIRLRNCPFHPLASRAPELVCGINASYLSGLLEGLEAADLSAILAPREGDCCVEIARVEGGVRQEA